MNQVSTPMLIIKRLSDSWKLLVSVFAGILMATTLSSGAPVYLNALEQLDFNASLDRFPSPEVQISIFGREIPLTQKSLQGVDRSVDQAIENNLSQVYEGHETALAGAASLIGIPSRPLPKGGGEGIVLARGFLHSLSNLEGHVRVVDGRMATDVAVFGTRGMQVEAVIGVETARRFGVKVDDLLVFTPTLESTMVTEVLVVGLFEPDDLTSEYWTRAAVFLDPPPVPDDPPPLVQIDPDEPPLMPFIAREALLEAVGEPEHASLLGTETYLSTGVQLAGIPGRPLPESGGAGLLIPIGHFQSISNLDKHISLQDGVMSSAEVSLGPGGPVVEALVTPLVASRFILEVGDEVTVTPALGSDALVSVTISGIMEPLDPTGDYWTNAGVLLGPTPFLDSTEGLDQAGQEQQALFAEQSLFLSNLPVGVQPLADAPTVTLFVREEAIVESTRQASQGTLAKRTWFISVEKERFKQWSVSESRQRLQEFENEVLSAMPGSSVAAGVVRGLTGEGRRANFLSKVPLYLLVAVVVLTVLVFLAMMVSYLTQSRESDVALLGTRGASGRQLLRIYAFEGLLMTVVAVIAAPFLATAIVALAGKLPPFTDFSGGALLPVDIWPAPFLAALAVGALCLLIYVLPGPVGAHGGILVHRLRASRPPSAPLIHRYYVDLALLALGGLIFWELRTRGQFVSGGLFKEVEVDETLLVAPVLFLVAVALLFLRLFPMVLRYISGESALAVHVFTAAVVAAVGVALAVDAAREDDPTGWVAPAALVLAVALVYALTNLSPNLFQRLAGILTQAVLIALTVAIRPLESGSPLLAPSIGLICIVPAQLAFLALRESVRLAPAWITLGMWNMSRNPMRYAWLVLLLVLVTGVGILSTTLGGTLERSREERILYDVGADFRVPGLAGTQVGVASVKTAVQAVPGVSATQALRSTASIGRENVELLGLETKEFGRLAWYRDDFSHGRLDDLLAKLKPGAEVKGIELPEGAETIALRIKPLEVSPFTSLGVVLKDDVGSQAFVNLRSLDLTEWLLFGEEIPPSLQPPLYLVSILVYEPPDVAGQTAGAVLIDDIHVTTGPDGRQVMLEDFEGDLDWVPLAPTTLRTDHELSSDTDAYRGNGAAYFSYAGNSFRGYRGFYYSPTDGPVPMVASLPLLAENDYRVGELLSVHLDGRWVSASIVGSVDFFPTMDPEDSFMLADMDTVLAHVNVLPPTMNVRPGELFVKSPPDSLQQVRDALSAAIPSRARVLDGAAMLESLSLNPFTNAGWRPMVLLAPAIGILAAAVGYVTYLLLFTKQSGSEMGSLESLGLSRLQAFGLLSFEHLTVSALGVALGTWAGFQMSTLIVAPLATTESGDPVVPPFILTTEWALLIVALAMLLGILVVSLIALTMGVRRINLQALSRLGGM